jgi:glycosyltransferase involved in cell wall biosynthesis
MDEFASLPREGCFRAKFPETLGKTLLLFLGRIHRIKGLDRLVRAFGTVSRSLPDAHLVIAGYDSNGYAAVLRHWLEEQGLRGKFTFAGPLVGEHKLAAFRDCDLFVMPSYQENFGMAALEAMACGSPVIVSDGVYLYPEIQKAGAGLVVNGDPAGLASAIETLLRDPRLRARMGEAGRRLARDQFSAERVATQMRSVYQSVLNGSIQPLV